MEDGSLVRWEEANQGAPFVFLGFREGERYLHGSIRHALFDRVDALARGFGVLGIGVLQQHLIVINQGALPAVISFVKLRDVEAAARLFHFERLDEFLRVRDAGIARVERHEITERGNGLGGDALVVFGGFGLFIVGDAFAVKGLHADFLLAVAIGGAFVGFGGGRVVADHFIFMRLADIQLGRRSHFAVGAVLDDLFIHFDRLVHRRKERDDIPELEPLAGEIAIGDAKLALNNFVVVFHLGITLRQRLVGLEGFLILLARFVAAADQILGLGGVVRERPLLDGAPGGLEGEAVILLVKSALG